MSDTIPMSESSSGQMTALRITVVAGPDAGATHVVNRPRVVVGRGETADVQLSDKAVSEFHLEMTPSGQGIRFSDCGSRNGVRVSGVRVERGIAPSGCILTLGMTSVKVELADEFALPMLPAASFGRLIGGSPAMQKLYAQLEKLATTDLAVLIEGETGTGKELAARALYTTSPRRNGPFVVLDCTTLQRELAPSRLFGHERGAFTGAVDSKVGVFAAAQCGVLFLDEVGELPLELQPMLLRVLQEREVTPVGSTQPRKVNVRVLSATHRDLRVMVNCGKFRADLYYRLVQDTVTMPPLRQRRADIPLLIDHFLSRLAADIKLNGIDDDALAALSMREFPGNIRELQHVIERLAWLTPGPTITVGDLMNEHTQSSDHKRMLDTQRLVANDESTDPPGTLRPYKESKQIATDSFERNYLVQLLSYTGNNLLRAARQARLQRHSLRELLKKHGLYTARD